MNLNLLISKLFQRKKDAFIIDDVVKEDSKLTFQYRVVGDEFAKFFWLGEMFSIEYNQKGIDTIPNSIAYVPIVANVLPIIWFWDATIIVPELDEDFYKAIPKIKKAYEEMLPWIPLKGKLIVKKIVKNKNIKNGNSATFFTGGVDSYSTLITRLNEKPDLITIWGADIDFENENGWKKVKSYVQGIGKKEKLNNKLIKASIRRFIDNSVLENRYHELLNDNWWHAVQHGMGLNTLAAPLAYLNGYDTIYMPSTYTKKDKVVCASLPQIDNEIKYADTKIFHDGYEKNRMQKVKNICNYVKKNKKQIELHVCYRSLKGDNCCMCEKCYRTIMAILSEGEDPNKYGFVVDKNTIADVKKNLKKQNYIEDPAIQFWKTIQKNLKKNIETKKIKKTVNDLNISWLLKVDFKQMNKK